MVGTAGRFRCCIMQLLSSAGHSANRSASLQIRKLRTQGLGLRICEPISYRKHLWICDKKIEIYRKSTTSLGIVSAIFKKIRFYDSMYRQI